MEGRLIPFIGAGVSLPLGLPDWGRLVDFIAQQLDFDPDVFRLNGTDQQLAGYYVAQKGKIGPLRSELDRLFNPSDAAILDSKVHRALVDLGFPVIYTTNYDRIIERAFKLHNKPCRAISSLEDIDSSPINGETQIVKFHGTFDDDESLVLTESSYFERFDFESPIDIKLRADMLGRSLLFVGYSLTDVNIRYMLYKMHRLRAATQRDFRRKSNAYLVTFGRNEVQAKLLEGWDIQVVELGHSPDKEECVAKFLEALS